MTDKQKQKKMLKAKQIWFRCAIAGVEPARWVTHWLERWKREARTQTTAAL